MFCFRNHSFEYQEHGHDSVCCTAMDMCIVTKGYHSINAGRYFKKGLILSPVYHVEELFPHVRTDGRQWYSSHTGEKLKKAEDFRFAALYTLLQGRARTSEGKQVDF